MSNAEDINDIIQAMSQEDRNHLQHLFVHLVQVVSDKKLSGFFMHIMPSPDDSPIEAVLVHTIKCDYNEVEEMMCNFLAARNAAVAAATSTDPTRKH